MSKTTQQIKVNEFQQAANSLKRLADKYKQDFTLPEIEMMVATATMCHMQAVNTTENGLNPQPYLENASTVQ